MGVNGLVETSSPEMIKLTLDEMRQKDSSFQWKFGQALKDGFFYVQIPEKCAMKISEAVRFAANIRNDESLKRKDLGNPRLGYQERHGTQAVAFSAMKHQWQQVFPSKVAEVAEEMNAIALQILKEALQQLSVPEEMWSLATGELTAGKGENVFSCNHYMPGEQKIGLFPHKDMGWITVLFVNKVGLQTSLDGKKWIDIPPKDGYFVVNFGRAFELLINSTDKLRASLHRVERLEKKRMVFGVFINHNTGTSIYELNEDGALVLKQSYEEYSNQCFTEFSELQKTLELQGSCVSE